MKKPYILSSYPYILSHNWKWIWSYWHKQVSEISPTSDNFFSSGHWRIKTLGFRCKLSTMLAQYQHRFWYKTFILLPVVSCQLAVALVIASFTGGALVVRTASDTLHNAISRDHQILLLCFSCCQHFSNPVVNKYCDILKFIWHWWCESLETSFYFSNVLTLISSGPVCHGQFLNEVEKCDGKTTPLAIWPLFS